MPVISSFMKRDGRSLDRQTQEAIRLMAVERVREGESAAEVIAAYGFHRTTIYKWLTAALQPGVGIKALRSTKATGRPRSLTPTQERQVFRWIDAAEAVAARVPARSRGHRAVATGNVSGHRQASQGPGRGHFLLG